jgi:hypothetical protein
MAVILNLAEFAIIFPDGLFWSFVFEILDQENQILLDP